MPAFTVGLDLGQANDYSALVVVEHVWRIPSNMSPEFDAATHPELRDSVRAYRVVALRRWERSTSYFDVCRDVARTMRTDALRFDGRLHFDNTGVGRAIGDLLFELYSSGQMGSNISCAVTFTQQSKADMVSNVLMAIQRGRLEIHSELALASVLEEELLQFRQKIRASGTTSYDVARTDQGHGDLATALMLAMIFSPYTHAGQPRLISAETV